MLNGKVGFDQPEVSACSWQDSLRLSWENYFVRTLGRPIALALERADEEISGASAAAFCSSLVERSGVQLEGARVLEVGSGHGTLALELAKHGADVIGVEPCKPWRDIAMARAAEVTTCGGLRLVDGNAESLGFDKGFFDVVISRQVLEHVRHPKKALAEMRRVVRDDGYVCIDCENYLAFHEQHYDLPWFPLLPKVLASKYLRVMGRDPGFLIDNINYVTSPHLLWWCVANDLWSKSWGGGARRGKCVRNLLIAMLRCRRTMFSVGFHYLLRPLA